ncbi:MAG TPA: nuclear transport factor 2 family protein [Gaiellaceae bacterium]|nr:nuclear transport factor 2 family protein [Gaiellaceae bacterium]
MSELMHAHVRAFNHGVESGDWSPMLARFSDDAELHFVGPPAGPFVGRDAIAAAYEEQPPDDRIVLLGVQEEGDHKVVAAYAWEKGGTGRLELEHDRGAVTRLTVIFD